MNLWRAPLDESSGRVLGPPEAITAPSEWSGQLSLSREGKHILYATSENKTNLERTPLDPASLTAGRLGPVTQGSHGVRSCDVSPDGRWVAFHTSIPQEDLFIVRPDGSGLRQLTNDAFRDRYPRWSPDGSRLIFQSDRSGRSEIWSIRADGSALEPVTRTSGSSLSYPVWSPDGRRLAFAVTAQGTELLDLTLPPGQRKPEPLPPVSSDGQLFSAISWSPDGKWLAGSAELRDSHSLPGIVLYSLVAKKYARVTDRGQVPRWLQDGRTLIFRDQGSILALDIPTRRIHEVLAPRLNSSFITHCVAPDGRTLFVSQVGEEGDICMLTLR
jgi:Tol biopolymer transport system component